MYFASNLSDSIQRTDYKAHVSLFDYKLQALNGLWKARKTAQIMMDEVIAERSKRLQLQKESLREFHISGQPSTVASELTLLMLFPLLESQTKSDPSLRSKITDLLSDFFQKSPPMSIKV